MSDSTTLEPLQQTSSPVAGRDKFYDTLILVPGFLVSDGVDWSREPPQMLNDKALGVLLSEIIKTAVDAIDITKDWKAQARQPELLELAVAHEPTLKQWLQKCWETGKFSAIGSDTPKSLPRLFSEASRVSIFARTSAFQSQ